MSLSTTLQNHLATQEMATVIVILETQFVFLSNISLLSSLSNLIASKFLLSRSYNLQVNQNIAVFSNPLLNLFAQYTCFIFA